MRTSFNVVTLVVCLLQLTRSTKGRTRANIPKHIQSLAGLLDFVHRKDVFGNRNISKRFFLS